MSERELQVGGFYRHFKNHLYQVKCIAYHSETKEKLVVYQALYGDYSVYVRPFDMFMSEVDHDKYPEVKQKYRFEQVILTQETTEQPLDKQLVSTEAINDESEDSYDQHDQHVEQIELEELDEDEDQVDPRLMQFLDAETYQDKLDVLLMLRNRLDDKLIDSMAASLDIEVPEEELDNRYTSLRRCILTHIKYEQARR